MQVTLEILNLIVATNLIGSYYFKDIIIHPCSQAQTDGS